MDTRSIADIRKDYIMASLEEADAGADPISFFQKWFDEARAAAVNEVNAMTLATVDASSVPHARIVLLKAVDSAGFTFFTNYHSSKGHDLAVNPNAALVFFWPELERQVRIEGLVAQVSAAESDAYFNSRPEGSRLGAWASPQSQVISSRSVLEDNETAFAARYNDGNIPRPEHWGGYRLQPRSVEFWQGRASRLHDRIRFEHSDQTWSKVRLAP